jgi:hypothetical protein
MTMIDKQQQQRDGKSTGSVNNNDQLPHNDDTDDDFSMPKIILSRAVSDGINQGGLRSASAPSYSRTKKRRGGAVTRMNNGVLASSSNPSMRRITVDSMLSASDYSALDDIQLSLRSELSRSITSSQSNQNQEQQQQYNELAPPPPPTTTINDESNDHRINGHEHNNNVNEKQTQEEQPFLSRCCNDGWRYVFACSPMKRYKKRSSSITMLENQYFIPPPEENTTFVKSILYTMNGYGQDFVVWIYQASFFAVLVISLTAYYALVFAFAGVVVAMENASDRRCTFVTDMLLSSESAFEFAFELSWTTFTTVGYGTVAPSGEDCYPIRIGCSLFAFMGLLFNSLSAAIFFSKLERVLAKASVTFSSSICLQFETIDADRSARVDSYRSMGHRLSSVEGEAVPYPFLEFRIVNDHANYASRAVRNASCAALVSLSGKHAEMISGGVQESSELYREVVTKSFSVDETDHASPITSSTANGLSLPQYRPVGKTKPSFFSVAKTVAKSNALAASAKTKPTNEQDESGEHTSSGEERASTSSENIDPAPAAIPSARRRRKRQDSKMAFLSASIKQTAIIVQENDSGKGQQATPEGRVYFPLELEPSTNPYMKNVWYLRHTLNAKSPLLRYSVREKLKRDGAWDAEVNTYQDIIASLVDFHKINVTFKGTSSASNSLLFTQKVCE